MKCDTCRNKDNFMACDYCVHDPSRIDWYENMTNADRIRSMSDEELARFLAKFDPHCCNCPADKICKGCHSTPPRDCEYWFEEWLEQPYEENEE